MSNVQEFKTAYDNAKLLAADLFSEVNDRNMYLEKIKNQLLVQYGFLQPQLNSGKIDVVKNFIRSFHKFDSNTENVSEFFSRLERRFNVEDIKDNIKIDILENLLPSSYYLPYNCELSFADQYILYKERALTKAKCTPIDLIYELVNVTFEHTDSIYYIIDNLKFKLDKLKECYSEVDLTDLFTYILLFKSIPRSIRLVMAQECRPDKFSDFSSDIQRFMSNKNKSIGFYLSAFKGFETNKNNNPVKNSNNSNFSNSNFKNKFDGSKPSKPSLSNNFSSVKAKVKCEFCKRTGHSESDCWSKNPDKRPKSNYNFRDSTVSATNNNSDYKPKAMISNLQFNGCSEFVLAGKINDMNCNNMLLDTGAKIAAFNKKYCNDYNNLGRSMTITTMSDHIEVGSYPLVNVNLKTKIFDGDVVGIKVDELKYDCLLPVLKTDKCDKITLNLKSGTIDVSNSYVNEINNENVNSDVGFLSNIDFKKRLPKVLTVDLIRSSQITDVDCRKLYQKLKDDESMFLSPQVELKLVNNLICKVNKGDSKPYSIYLPKNLISLVLKTYHDNDGHISHNYVAKKISENFYFDRMYDIIKDYVNCCEVCQRDTTMRHHKKVPCGLTELTAVPFDHVCIDFITHFDTSHSGFTYLLTVVDVSTRFANAIPLKTLTAEESLVGFINFHCYKYGFPGEITTDCGRQFTSKLFKDFCSENNIKLINTAPYHPQSNGVVEKFNGTISNMIKHTCVNDLRNWDEHIHKLLFSYNRAVRNGTQFSPFDIIFSYDVREPFSKINSETDVESVNVEDFVNNARLNADDNRNLAVKNLKVSQTKNKISYDKDKVERAFQVHDLVLLKKLTNKGGKMLPRWHGPYPVIEVVSNTNYRIRIKNKDFTYHIDLLKLYKHELDLNPVDNVNCNSEQIDHIDTDFIVNNINYMPIVDKIKDIDVIKEFSDSNFRSQIQSLIDKYSYLYTDSPAVTNVLKHKIVVKDDEPVKRTPYSVPLAFRNKFKEELERMLNDNIIEPSNSDYSSPCIIVPRKDKDKIRLVIDYRSLNSKLIKDREPISCPQSIFAKLSGNKVFSTIDLKNGFWQIPLSEESKKYTAFITEFGLYQFKVLPFGIANGPAEFSRLMRKIFPDHPNIFTFLDDILIATVDFESHVKVLEYVFKTLLDANLKINIDKSFFGVEEIKFLGQTLDSNFMYPQKDKIEAILDFPLPAIKKQLQSFLGLCNYYRNYLVSYAQLSYRLYDLVKKSCPKRITWTDELICTFNNLKNALSSDIKLSHIDPNLPLILQTDASAFAVGAILGQRLIPNGPVLPITCISKKLSDTQKRYSTLEREAYGIVWAVEKLSFYLLGNFFIIETDHKPLTYMNSTSKSKDKIRRWQLMLLNFNYEIRYLEGKRNLMSDSLSRFTKDDND